jgi:hypothetical protein
MIHPKGDAMAEQGLAHLELDHGPDETMPERPRTCSLALHLGTVTRARGGRLGREREARTPLAVGSPSRSLRILVPAKMHEA